MLFPHLDGMSRYFFHVHSAVPSHDESGEELADDEAAWRTATNFAGEVMRDIDEKYRPVEEWSLEVTKEAGRPLYFIIIQSRKIP